MVVGGRDADAVEAGDIGRRACLGERLALDGHKQFLSFGLPDIFRSGERWSWNPHDPPSWDLLRPWHSLSRRLGRLAVLPVARQRGLQFVAGADAELGEHLAQVPFDRACAEEQLAADLRV